MMIAPRRCVAGALLASVLVAAPPPAAAQATPERGASVEGITEYTLPNGLRVLLFPDESKPTTTVNITYFVGSRHESYGETGMAHLLEHLVFKGTPRHPNIMQELTERGAQPNGTTSWDRTNYYATFPASSENLAWALDLEADRMVNSFIAKKDLDSEMTVVRNEFEAGENSPFGVLLQRTMSTAFLWHNYGQTTIGARSDLENVPIERLQAFYRKFYQPDNALLVVAGKFDEAEALRLVAQHFGPLPRPDRTGANQLFPTYTREPAQDGERLVTLRRAGDLQVLMASYHVPAGSHSDFAAVQVLSSVLGNAPSGRLHKALVDERRAARVGSFALQLAEPGVLLAFAEVRREDSLDAARDAFIPAIESVLTEAPTAEEVERARTALLRNIELTLNASDVVGLQLSEWASMGDWRLLFIHRDRLRGVTAADVQRVAQAYIKRDNRTLGLFIPTDSPDRAVIPEAPAVGPMVASYRGDSTRVAGEAFDPSPANIEARTTRLVLPNGFRLNLLPKQTRGGSVNAALTLRIGSEQALMHRGTAGGMAGSMLMRGTTTRSRQELRDELARLQAQANLGGGATSVSGAIQTTRANLPAVLRLVAEAVRQPSFDEREFAQLKEQMLASIEEQRSEPQAVASMALSRHMNTYPKGHPRYAATIEEQIAEINAVTLDEVRRFHADFYGAAAGDLTIVGDFDAGEVQRLAAELFGDWRAPEPFERLGATFHEPAAANLVLETPDKANAFFIAATNLDVTDEHPDYPALVVANYIMGGGVLNSRLAIRIRQQDGLSYAVGTAFSAHPIDSGAAFLAFAIYAPENAARLETAYREEMERALREGFTVEEVETAKQGYLQTLQVARSQDAGLARALGTTTYFGRTMEWDAAFEARVAALTAADVSAAFARHVALDRITVVKAGDFVR